MKKVVYKYPAHATDSCIVTTLQGLKVLKEMGKKYNTTPLQELRELRKTDEYKEWLHLNAELLSELRERIPEHLAKPMIEFFDETDYTKERENLPKESVMICDVPEMLTLGVYLSSQGDLSEDEIESLITVYSEYGVKVKKLRYGSEIYQDWLELVQD